MAPVERKRRVRSVTLDDELVEQAKAAGLRLSPKVCTLSGVIDRALAEFITRRGKTKPHKAAK